MKNSKNRKRLKRSFMHRALKPAGWFISRLAVRQTVRETANMPVEPTEILNFGMELMKLWLALKQNQWLNNLFPEGEPCMVYVDLAAEVVVSQGSRPQHVLRIVSRLHGIISLAKWLKYALFFNQAMFSFRELGKPSQGVSPPWVMHNGQHFSLSSAAGPRCAA